MHVVVSTLPKTTLTQVKHTVVGGVSAVVLSFVVFGCSTIV